MSQTPKPPAGDNGGGRIKQAIDDLKGMEHDIAEIREGRTDLYARLKAGGVDIVSLRRIVKEQLLEESIPPGSDRAKNLDLKRRNYKNMSEQVGHQFTLEI